MPSFPSNWSGNLGSIVLVGASAAVGVAVLWTASRIGRRRKSNVHGILNLDVSNLGRRKHESIPSHSASANIESENLLNLLYSIADDQARKGTVFG